MRAPELPEGGRRGWDRRRRMNRKKELVDVIGSMAGRYSAYEVFNDWIRCMAMSISNSCRLFHDKIWLEREQKYADTMRKYNDSERMTLCEMTAWLTETLEDGPDDALGYIYMALGMGSNAAGQFFTPFHLSELTASLAIAKEMTEMSEPVMINEPSCGGGGMILAAAKVMNDLGIDYQKMMRVVAQDLDWKGVYMCYVQLSLLGIEAVCIQGDTLKEPVDLRKIPKANILFTPRAAGILL